MGVLINKPDTCQGCPMYGNGKGFVPDRLVEGCRVVVLAQNPGKDEERGQMIVGYDGKAPLYETVEPRPLIGATGYQLRTKYLPLTGETVEKVSLCNVLKCRWKGSNELPKGDVLKQAVAHCTQAHLRIPESAELIVAMGGPAFEFTQPKLVKEARSTKSRQKNDEKQTGGILTTWRGFVAPETVSTPRGKAVPVFAVVHIADFFRDPAQRVIGRLDWKRIGRWLRKEWPLEIPERLIATDDVVAVDQAFDEADQAEYVVIDTEFNPVTKFLSLIGLGWRGVQHGQGANPRTIGGVQLQWTDSSVSSAVRAQFIRRLARLVTKTTVVFQNAKADLPVIEQNLHVAAKSFRQIEDTLHMHAVLYSELPHRLEFLASIYGDYPKLKHLQHTDELLYNWGDVLETLVVYEALRKELSADPVTKGVYENQSLPLIPITMKREKKGIRINQPRLEELIVEYTAKLQAFEQMAHAYAGYELNLRSSGEDGQLATHLRVYDDIDLPSVDEKHIATERDKYLPFDREYEEKHGFSADYLHERFEAGAHPLLELRAGAIHYAHTLSQDLLPLRGKDRVYPSLRHDAQASGRWSTTKPALAKVPNDLLPLYVPDKGKVLFGADYDAQEPRIFMAEANSTYLKKAFNEKLDIHTLLVCDMFGWPHPPNARDPHSTPECAEWRETVGWGGKEDKRRTVSKNVRYERYYMGTGKQAINKAVKLGVPKAAMEKASRLVIQQDPNVADYHRKVKKLALTKRARSWGGRLRVSLGDTSTKPGRERVERELCNHAMQAGGVDILNLGVIEVCQTYPQVSLFYTRHDSFFFEIDMKDFTPELAEVIRRISEQPRRINGQDVAFPGTWKTMDEQGMIEKYTFHKEVKVA